MGKSVDKRDVADDLLPGDFRRTPSITSDDNTIARDNFTYPDYKLEDTRIVTVGVGPGGMQYKNTYWAHSRVGAKSFVEKEHGKILEANYTVDRCFFRVRRVK